MKQIIDAVKKLLKSLSIFTVKLQYPNLNLQYKSHCLIQNVKIFNGKDNSLNLGTGVSLRNCTFRFLGKGNHVEIHDDAKLKNITFWLEGNNNQIIIGKKTTTHGYVQLAACEGTSILIGDDCMFSHDIYVRTSDSHPIFNTQGMRINPPMNITIGNHVWLGMQCLILKGANIPTGCIVGARCTVTSQTLQKQSLIVGAPAKSIKIGIEWKRE